MNSHVLFCSEYVPAHGGSAPPVSEARYKRCNRAPSIPPQYAEFSEKEGKVLQRMRRRELYTSKRYQIPGACIFHTDRRDGLILRNISTVSLPLPNPVRLLVRRSREQYSSAIHLQFLHCNTTLRKLHLGN
jgi:hypothetical protein